MKVRQKGITWFSALVLLALLSTVSCSPITQYSVDMKYTPAFVPGPVTGQGEAVRIAWFQDLRKTDEPLVIGRVVRFDGARVRVFPKYKTASEAVTEGVRAYMAKSGTIVPAETMKWDLQEKTITRADRGILIGGSIDELEVNCVEKIPARKYDARMKLTIVLADMKNGTIFYRTSAESSSSMDYILFSEEKMEEQVNSVLASAIERMFLNSELKAKIKTAWAGQQASGTKTAAAPQPEQERKLGSGEETFVNPEEDAPPPRSNPIESKDIK